MRRKPTLLRAHRIGIAVALVFTIVVAVPLLGLPAQERWRRTVTAAKAEAWTEFVSLFPDSSFEEEIDRTCAVALLSNYFSQKRGFSLEEFGQPFLSKYEGRDYLNDLLLIGTHFERQVIAIHRGNSVQLPVIGSQFSFGTQQELKLEGAVEEIAVMRFPQKGLAPQSERALATYEFLLCDRNLLIARGATSLYQRTNSRGDRIDMLATREAQLKAAGIQYQHIAKRYGRIAEQ